MSKLLKFYVQKVMAKISSPGNRKPKPASEKNRKTDLFFSFRQYLLKCLTEQPQFRFTNPFMDTIA
jgi:hypothetical protein